jgi:hypothetical protein
MRNNIVLQVPKESEKIGGSSFSVISYIAFDYVSPFRSRDHPFVYLLLTELVLLYVAKPL